MSISDCTKFAIKVSEPIARDIGTVRPANCKRQLRKMIFRMLWEAKGDPGYRNYLIKDTNGNILMTEAVEHFQQLLN